MIVRWSTRLASMAALCFLVAVSSAYGLQCRCSDASIFSSCRWNGWTCTISESEGACYTGRKLLDDGSIVRTTDCVTFNLNPTMCDGGHDTDTRVYECCSSGDFCNEDLHPLLPSEIADEPHTTTSTIAVPSSTDTLRPSSTVTSSASSTDTLRPSSTATPSPSPSPALWSSEAVTPTPIVAGPLLCACSDPVTCPRQTCQTDYKCFRHDTFHEDGQHDTLMGCLHDTHGLDICSTSTKWLQCCDGQDYCNRDMAIGTPPSEDTPTDQETTPTTDQETTPTSDGQEDELFFILSLVVVLITIATVITILIFLATFCLRYHRERSQLASMAHLQEYKYISPNNNIHTNIRTPHYV